MLDIIFFMQMLLNVVRLLGRKLFLVTPEEFFKFLIHALLTKDKVFTLTIVYEQAGTELGQAQLQLELGFTLMVCCITLMITNYHCIS